MRALSITWIVLLLLAAPKVNGQMITNVTVMPIYPAPGNPVTIITTSTFTTTAFSVINNIYTDTVNHTIVVQLFKCRSQSPPATMFQDTSYTPSLPAGMYSLSVLLFSALSDSSGNCGAFSMMDSDNQNITVATTTSITENAKELLKLYPNPASSRLFACINGTATICITDVMGRLAKKMDVNGNTPIDVSDLPSGMYNCSINTAKGEYFSQKIVITK